MSGSQKPVAPPLLVSRLVPTHVVEDMIGLARVAYVNGEIKLDGLEAAVRHIRASGFGDEWFPYLPGSRR